VKLSTKLIAGVAGLLGYILLKRYRLRSRLPHGPRGYPIVGNVPQMDQQRPHETLFEWSKTYGAIYTVNFLGSYIIVLNSEEAIREMLVEKSSDFAGRPYAFRIKVRLLWKQESHSPQK